MSDIPKGSVLHVMKYARELMVSVGWTYGIMAGDAKGNSVSPRSPKAVCFCASGALQRACIDLKVENTSIYFSAERKLNEHLVTVDNYVDLNDFQGKEAIFRLFDRTIAEMESKGEYE